MILMPMDKRSFWTGVLSICLLLTCALILFESAPTSATTGGTSIPNSDFYLREAMNYSQNGSYPLALERINLSLEIDDELAEAWLLKGRILFGLGYLQEAIRSLDQVLRIDQSLDEAWSLKGEIMMETGRYRMAQLCFDSALRLDPGNMTLYNRLAQSQLMLEDYDHALRSYKKALSLEANNTEILFNQGDLFLTLAR